jgi:hypothetical protein
VAANDVDALRDVVRGKAIKEAQALCPEWLGAVLSISARDLAAPVALDRSRQRRAADTARR